MFYHHINPGAGRWVFTRFSGQPVMRLDMVPEDLVIFENVDMLNGTPVTDIKPYVPDSDIWQGGDT